MFGDEEVLAILEENGLLTSIEEARNFYKEIGTDPEDVDTYLNDPHKAVDVLYYMVSRDVVARMYTESPTWRASLDGVADEETNLRIVEEIEDIEL